MVNAKKLSTTLAMVTACVIAYGASRTMNWNVWPSLSEGVAGGAMGRVGNSIIYAGGTTWRGGEKFFLSNVVEYSPATQKWTSGPALPEPLAYGAYLQGGPYLEVFGGAAEHTVSQTCWRLDHGAKAWTECGVLPRSSLFASAAAIGADVYLVGGCRDLTGLSTCTTNVLRRDAQGKWAHVTDMPQGAVALSAAAALEGQLYLFGGATLTDAGAVENLRTAHAYDPRNNTWKTLHEMPLAVRSASAIALDKTHILIIGGYGDDPSAKDVAPGFRPDAWIYDIASDTYEQTTSLPFGISGIGLAHYDDAIIGVGGEDKMRGRSTRVLHGIFAKHHEHSEAAK